MGELNAVVGKAFKVICPASGYPLDKITWSRGKHQSDELYKEISMLRGE